MKKISRCDNCERELYTNELNLCKRCHNEVGLEVLQQLAKEPEDVEEEAPALDDLGIGEGTAEETSEVVEEVQEESEESKSK